MIKIDFCNHKIVGRETYMTFGTHIFCHRCVKAMINKFWAFPNDGTLAGGMLAQNIHEHPKEIIKKLRTELGEIKEKPKVEGA